MKKLLLLILTFTALSFMVFAQEVHWADNPDAESINYPNEEPVWQDGEDTLPEGDVFAKEKEPWNGIRRVEIGVLNGKLSFSNDFMTAKQFFNKVVVVDLDELKKGLGLNFALGLSPVFFNFNNNDQWGFGLSLGVDAIGAVRLSGNMITFSMANMDRSDVSAAAYAEVAVPGFFRYDKFKIKVRPAFFYPIMFAKSDITYTFKTEANSEGTKETILMMNMDMMIHTAFPLEGDFSLTGRPGVDISFGAEYPLAEVIGLTEAYPFLDFIVGLDFYNVPLIPTGALYNYQEMAMTIGSEEAIDFFGGDLENFFNEAETKNGEARKTILRPFKVHAWAEWWPFDEARFISFIPTLGLAVSPLYYQPVSFDGGVAAKFDVSKVFVVQIGTGYLDRVWNHSLDLCLNARAVEFNFGLSLQSARYLKSWAGGGFGLDWGFKFGW